MKILHFALLLLTFLAFLISASATTASTTTTLSRLHESPAGLNRFGRFPFPVPTPLRQVDVSIISALPNNSPPLVLHCFSGDDELGYRDLHSGELYRWDFFAHPWTKFLCSFNWTTKTQGFAVYDLKVGLSGGCGDAISNDDLYCYWLVRDDGFYLSKMYNPNPSLGQRTNSWLNK
ncbi:OLC1v1012665C1 [Oldenlandia corymbosa var. corymbosa]|uniref:S-protein homolog n=1 Tax=Oldenlandia corymbosa var. corymbosa TaxID=529605 RepID=A0AAV1DYI9_OLDCO|nr:OLC1v1012665C1 [Oldenlandia corymbosa var. corymbosa]